MDHGWQPKSQLASLTFARNSFVPTEPAPCLTLGANGEALKFCFFVIRVYYEKLGHMVKPLAPNFRSDLSVRLRDIAEKQVSAKLKPIVGSVLETIQPRQ